MLFQEFTEDQSKHFIDSIQLFEGYEETEVKLRSYQGHMQWKEISGKQYLYRIVDTAGNGKSLGPRNPEAEAKKEAFDKGKKELKERQKSLKERLTFQARYNRAARLNRLPKTASQVLQTLHKQNLLNNFTVVGTYSLYAYEAMAAGQILGDLTATQDIDLLWDENSKIKLASDSSVQSLLEVLQKADSTFQKKGRFSAMNTRGFLVDFIKKETKPPWKKKSKKEINPFGNENDIEPVPISSLKWLISSEKISQIVIGFNGFPIRINVVDPRSFCIHKSWMSGQPGRERVKRARDKKQALLVAKLSQQYLPQYHFQPEEMKMFPKEVVEETYKWD